MTRIPCPALCPVAQLLDLLAHQAVEWDDLGQGGADCQLAGVGVFVEGQVEGFDEALLDLRLCLRILELRPMGGAPGLQVVGFEF